MKKLAVGLGLVLVTVWGAGCAKSGPGGSPAAVAPSLGGAVKPSATSGAAPVALSGTVTDKGHVDDTGKGANFELDVEAGDNYFAPTFVKASPGATVKVTVKNTGASPHTFTIDGTAVNIVLNTPGQSGTAMVTLPASGSLAFSCTYHKAIGMQGAFYVG